MSASPCAHLHARTHSVRMCGPPAHLVGFSPHSTHLHRATALDEHRTLQHSDWCYASPFLFMCSTTAIAPITSVIPLEEEIHATSEVPCPAGGSRHRHSHHPLEADAPHCCMHCHTRPTFQPTSAFLSPSILLPPSSILALFGFLSCCRRRLFSPLSRFTFLNSLVE